MKERVRRLLPRAVRPHRILRGRLRGYRIVTSWHDYPGAILGRTERALLGWFEEHVGRGETWLDVGAHYGYTALAMSRLVGPEGRVFAFEPMMATAGHLAKTRVLNDLPQLVVVPMGLGEPADMEVRQPATVRGMADSMLDAATGLTDTIMVARLDWLWSRLTDGGRRIHGVKIDVQGMELGTLRGMQGLLREHRPKLVVELHRGVDRTAVLELLESLGYGKRGTAVEPEIGEVEPRYLDDRSYYFRPVGG
jgi:FkbM family methyltransferase